MADGSIKISIEVDGKQVDVAAKQLDNLEASGNRSGKGIKAAEDSLDSLSDASGKAGSNVKGAGDSIEGLGESGSKAGQGLKGAEGAIDGVADSSTQAASSVKGAGDTIESLGSSGDSASKGLQGVDGALDGVADSSAQASDSVRGASDAMADVDGKTNQASGSIKTFAASIGLVAIAAKAFDAMRASVDQAIGRFDTLNAFPKVLQALGVSAEDSEAAMAKLSDGIDGLPTKLNDIAATAQRMYTSFGDMDKAADTALALNNALLGSGASADQAKRGTDQYIKSLQTGEITMDTWNTLSETMDVGLVKLAEAFGYTGKSAKDDLYNALKDGTITLDEFNEKLIEVGTGTGIMAELARENSLGLATSFGNLRNAIANGVAKIIEAFNNLSIAVTGKDIAQNIDSMKVVVNEAFNLMKSTIEATTPVFKVFGEVVKTAIAVIKPLTPAILGMVTAFTALMIINKVVSAINASNAALAAAKLSSQGLTLATKGQMVAQIGSTAATKADTVAKAANLGMISASSLAIGVMTGRIRLAIAAKIAFAAASRMLGTTLGVMAGPVGWITLAIGGLIGAAIGIVKWFNRSTEEGERLKEETEALGESTDSLVESMNQSASAYKDRINDIEATREANTELVQTVEKLADKENKSAEDKRNLSAAVSQLNGEVEGLNVSYNEEADMLSESTEKMQARIDLMAEQDKANAAQERLTEILKEQQEIELQLDEVTALRKDWNRKLNDSTVTSREHKKAVEELDEQEQALKDTNEQLGIQYDTTKETMVESSQNARDIITDNNHDIIVSYEDLEGAAKEAFDSLADKYSELKDAATDAFNEIESETEHTMDSMIETMQHNQEMVEQWGENQAKLMEWAGENSYESFIPFIEDMGIDQAAVLQEMVDDLDETNGTSGEKLSELAETYQEGGDLSANALKEALGDGFEEVIDLMSTLVERMETTLRVLINEADWEEYGLTVGKETASGVDESAEVVEESMRIMGERGTTALDLVLGTYDFAEKGEEIPTDMSGGMETGSPYVKAASEMLGREAIDPMTTEIDNADIEGTGDDISVRLSGSINHGKPSVAWASGEIGKAPGEEISSEIDATPFETIGGSASTRTGEGITTNKGDATGAANNLTNDVKSEFANGFESSIYVNYGNNTGSGTGTGIDGSAGIATSAASRLASDVVSTTSSGLPLSAFEGIGRNVGQGAANGINGAAGLAIAAAETMAGAVQRAAESVLEVHSPSRVFYRIGEFVGSGFDNGISSKESSVVSAIVAMTTAMISRTKSGMQMLDNTTKSGVNNMSRTINQLPVIVQSAMAAMQAHLSAGASTNQNIMSRLSTNMTSPFNSLPGRMSSIGSSAMSGLNAGLNGGAGRVMSTARNIASRVASTMQKALKINSPSHLMRDDVGRWVPAGIAVGIEDNAKLVYRALDDLAAGMIKPVSPEVALGTSAMAYNGSDSMAQAVRNIKFPDPPSNNHAPDAAEKQPAIINLYVGSKQVAREIVDDITNLQNRQNNRKQYTLRGGMA
ncbi:tape measure protein [Oceanobacillus sp. CFH 90083]|uniref:tape measure protein n=1 Tax=Oceanobacillus sp. CFH 90083 TaxID=2592336 RepID=UPI00128C3D1B|nr:tape measure protein [Oceanobacillus sp. CFH 90083]